ncbi:hypothetical protein [Salmonella sp. S102_03650]|uniref:hypothetical protein n=1 Tax=unclassified Salmonella TaxID=2614656 RepID=UPI0016590BA2|nr:hypothetical protein [Salmonella sp. S102_03650]MDJ5689995.1 hypothetical protein [Salmonella enterica]
MQYTDIQIWQPGILRNTDYLNPGPAKLLAATLDKDIKIFKEGGGGRSARIMALALFSSCRPPVRSIC